MSVFGFDALPHLFGKAGLQDVLLFHLRGIAAAELAEAMEIGRRRFWGEGNHLKSMFEVEVGHGPLDQCIKTLQAKRIVRECHRCIAHGFNQNPWPWPEPLGPSTGR